MSLEQQNDGNRWRKSLFYCYSIVMSADRITEPYDVLENHFDPVKHEGDIFFSLSLSLSGPKWNGWRSLPARRCSFHVKGYAFVTTRKPPSLRIPAASFNFLLIKFNPNRHYSIQRKKYYFLRVTSKFWVRNCGGKFELKQRRCKSRLSSNPFGGMFIFQIASDLILRYLNRRGTLNSGVFQKKISRRKRSTHWTWSNGTVNANRLRIHVTRLIFSNQIQLNAAPFDSA